MWIRAAVAGLGLLLGPSVTLGAWHVEEMDGGLVIIGAGETPAGNSNFVALRCRGDVLQISADTMINADAEDDLAAYQNVEATLEIGGLAERQQVLAHARAAKSVGGYIAIVLDLDPVKSREVLRSIADGNRFEFTPRHPEISAEENAIRVHSSGFVAVLLAADKLCPDLMKR